MGLKAELYYGRRMQNKEFLLLHTAPLFFNSGVLYLKQKQIKGKAGNVEQARPLDFIFRFSVFARKKLVPPFLQKRFYLGNMGIAQINHLLADSQFVGK